MLLFFHPQIALKFHGDILPIRREKPQSRYIIQNKGKTEAFFPSQSRQVNENKASYGCQDMRENSVTKCLFEDAPFRCWHAVERQ